MSSEAATPSTTLPGGAHDDEEEHEEHVNHEAWVIPYADILTLLMALFVVLWSMSTLDLQKFQALAEGFGEAFGGAGESVVDPFSAGGVDDGLVPLGGRSPAEPAVEPSVGSVDVSVEPSIGPDVPTRAERAEQALAREEQALIAAQREQATLEGVKERITQAAVREGLAEAVGFRNDPRGLIVTVVADRVLFHPGSATVQPEGARVLGLVADAVAGLDNAIAVEGHTDSRPIATARFPSNWELSTARATNVLRTLVDRHGLSADRVAAAGYADTRPVADNASGEGRASNRRVELVVLARAASGG